MFVHTPDYRYPWPIEVRRPSQTKPGTYELAGSFVMLFRQLSQEEATRLDADAAALPADASPEERNRWQFYAAKAAAVGWSGYSIDGTTEAEFTPENFARAFDDPHVALGIWRGWLKSLSEAVAGN